MGSAISVNKQARRLASTLFLVPHGTDRTQAGRRAAASILAEDPAGHALVLRGAHPDLIELSAMSGKQKIGIAQVREVIRQAEFVATQAPRKVCLVPQAEALTPEAANALLKVLEEPPRGLVFLLLAEQQGDLLPTIVSRSRIVRLHAAPGSDRSSRLERAGYPREDAEAILALVRDETELEWFLERRVDLRTGFARAADAVAQADPDALLEWSTGDDPLARRAALGAVLDRMIAGDRALAVRAARSLARLDLQALRRVLEGCAGLAAELHRRAALADRWNSDGLPLPAASASPHRARWIYRRIERAWLAVSHHTAAEAVLFSLFLSLEEVCDA